MSSEAWLRLTNLLRAGLVTAAIFVVVTSIVFWLL